MKTILSYIGLLVGKSLPSDLDFVQPTLSPIFHIIMDVEVFKNNFSYLAGKTGVYIFYDSNKNIVYIGRSTDLLNRIISSFYQREKVYYFSYMIIEDIESSKLIEANLIDKYKPLHNKQFKLRDFTIQVELLERSKNFYFENTFVNPISISLKQKVKIPSNRITIIRSKYSA